MIPDLHPGEIFDQHYQLLRPLSTAGGTADVWLAIDLNTIDDSIQEGDDSFAQMKRPDETALKVAIKIYRPKNALDIEGVQRFRDEFTIVYNCHHSNLIQPTHYSIWQEIPYLVLPYCSNGSSELLIGQLTAAADIWKYVEDVASGLAYLHANNPPIIHQDIKPANVLIDDKRNYAITDFGISATRQHRQLYNTNSGTLAYMAPERFVDETPRAESDIYAFGVTLFEILTNSVPFGEEGGRNQPDGKVRLNYQGRKIPTDIKRLIEACLDKDITRRPTAAQIAEAAHRQQYPIRRRLLWPAIAVATLAILAAVLLYAPKPEATAEAIPDVDSLYRQAMIQIQTGKPTTVAQGMKDLEDIGNKYSYVPALYEVGRTYGMAINLDTARYNPLKKALRIRMGNRNVKEFIQNSSNVDWGGGSFYKYFAESTAANNKAYSCFSKILENEEAKYYNEKKYAAFCCACYDIFWTNDPHGARQKFDEAKRYAALTQDTILPQAIDDNYLVFLNN